MATGSGVAGGQRDTHAWRGFQAAHALLAEQPVSPAFGPPAFRVDGAVLPLPDPLAGALEPPAELLTGEIGRFAAALAKGRDSSRSLAERSLVAIEAREELGAFSTVLDAEEVLAQADRLDEEAQSRGPRGALHGVTFTVKDNISVAGSPMRAGSEAYCEVPQDDAWVVARMRALGANLLGQTLLHEFATGFETPARNPHDPERTPGGSSGGAGIAAATGMGLVAFGTDTRASIRNPACYCGISGHRPSQGLIPTDGVLPLGFTMDTVGPLAPTMADVGLVVWMVSPTPIELPRSVDGLVVGVPDTALAETDEPVRAGFSAALELLREAGMDVVTLDAPDEEEIRVANAAGLLISRCEGTTFHHHLKADRGLYWAETRDQFDAAELVPAHVYVQAQRVREQLRRRWAERFESVDLVATPTSPVVPPLLAGAGVGMLSLSRTTILWSLLGTPTLSVPAPTVIGSLPVGLQLAGPGGMDGRVIGAALAFESARVKTEAG